MSRTLHLKGIQVLVLCNPHTVLVLCNPQVTRTKKIIKILK